MDPKILVEAVERKADISYDNWICDLYMKIKGTPNENNGIIIGNSLKGRTTLWYSMINDATFDLPTFKKLLLKHFFLDNNQWDIFIECTKARKKTNRLQLSCSLLQMVD